MLSSGPITCMIAIGVTVVSTQEQDMEVDRQVLMERRSCQNSIVQNRLLHQPIVQLSAAFINRSCNYRLLSSIDHATIGCLHQSIMQLSAAFILLCQSKNAASPLMIHRLKHRSRPSIHRCHQSMPSIGPIDRCHRSVPSIGPIDRSHRSVPSIDAINRSIDRMERQMR